MDQQERYLDVLCHAEEILGSRARMARFLGVSAEQIQSWLDGIQAPPLEVFLRSLDVIADGPYARGAKRLRVAVIDQR